MRVLRFDVVIRRKTFTYLRAGSWQQLLQGRIKRMA